jgi:hypothetical protein
VFYAVVGQTTTTFIEQGMVMDNRDYSLLLFFVNQYVAKKYFS